MVARFDLLDGEKLGLPPLSARAGVQGSAEAHSIPLRRSRRGDTTPHVASPRRPFPRWRRLAPPDSALELARARRHAAYERARATSILVEAAAERQAACTEHTLAAYDRFVAARERSEAARDRAARMYR